MLRLQEISMKFGGLDALSDISFEVEEGSIHGIIGPNGSGKTTLFNVINGIYKPTSGRVFFYDRDITGLSPDRITKEGIARTFQLLRIFPSMTVLDNLIVAQAIVESSSIVDAFLSTPLLRKDYLNLTDKAMDMLKTLGLESKAYNLADTISIGQRRMLQLGIGAIRSPKLLLLDECAAGLDPANIDKLLELLRLFRDRYGITILMIEHIMSVVMNICERLTVLDYGKLIFEGNPRDVQENESVIEAYLGTNP